MDPFMEQMMSQGQGQGPPGQMDPMMLIQLILQLLQGSNVPQGELPPQMGAGLAQILQAVQGAGGPPGQGMPPGMPPQGGPPGMPF